MPGVISGLKFHTNFHSVEILNYIGKTAQVLQYLYLFSLWSTLSFTGVNVLSTYWNILQYVESSK